MQPTVPHQKIGDYTIYIRNSIGSGAYGIIYQGINRYNQTVAAKTVDKTKLLKLNIKDLRRLQSLAGHPNVLKFLDVEEVGKNLWIIMEYCPHGDLNRVFKDPKLTMKNKVEIMHGTVSGIQYLHDNKIVHRDIKPGNILAASRNPLVVVKLTDFDISKFFDPDVETSVMSTNKGTMAFKAPEFFQRNERGELKYHKNVDIYAAGVTFLAIIQHTDGSKDVLIPYSETAKDISERQYPSVGLLTAERVKYKVQPLTVVKLDKRAPREVNHIKNVIHKMTVAHPEGRLLPGQVITELEKILKYLSCKEKNGQRKGTGRIQKKRKKLPSPAAKESSSSQVSTPRENLVFSPKKKKTPSARASQVSSPRIRQAYSPRNVYSSRATPRSQPSRHSASLARISAENALQKKRNQNEGSVMPKGRSCLAKPPGDLPSGPSKSPRQQSHLSLKVESQRAALQQQTSSTTGCEVTRFDGSNASGPDKCAQVSGQSSASLSLREESGNKLDFMEDNGVGSGNRQNTTGRPTGEENSERVGERHIEKRNSEGTPTQGQQALTIDVERAESIQGEDEVEEYQASWMNPSDEQPMTRKVSSKSQELELETEEDAEYDFSSDEEILSEYEYEDDFCSESPEEVTTDSEFDLSELDELSDVEQEPWGQKNDSVFFSPEPRANSQEVGIPSPEPRVSSPETEEVLSDMEGSDVEIPLLEARGYSPEPEEVMTDYDEDD